MDLMLVVSLKRLSGVNESIVTTSYEEGSIEANAKNTLFAQSVIGYRAFRTEYSLGERVQRQICRFHFMAALASHPRLVVSDDLVLYNAYRGFASWWAWI